MKGAFQSLALMLLAISCVTACSSDESTTTYAPSTIRSQKTADAPAVETSWDNDQNTEVRSLKSENEPLQAAPAQSFTPVDRRSETNSPQSLPRTANECVAAAREAIWHFSEYDDAVKLCDEALRISPDHVEALILRADAWTHLANFKSGPLVAEVYPERPRIEWENALRDFASASRFAEEGSSQAAIAEYGRRSVLDTLGRESYGDDDYNELIGQFDTVLAENPEDIECLAHRGLTRFDLTGSWSHREGLDDLTRALELDPGRLSSHQRLYNAYRFTGDTEAAMEIANEAVRRFPEAAGGFVMQYQLLANQGKFDLALQAANQAGNRSKSAHTTGMLAMAHARAGQLEKTIEYLLEIQRTNPDDPMSYYHLAIWHANSTNFHEAHDMAKEFSNRVPPTNYASRQLFAMIEERNAQHQLEKWKMNGSYSRWSETSPEKALARVEKQLREQHPTADSLTKCGVEYFRLGEYEKAIALFDRAIELDPRNAEAFGRRGVTLSRLEQLQRARSDFLKACQLDAETASR